MLADLNQQGANALLAATFEFLRRNHISGKTIVQFARDYQFGSRRARGLAVYRELIRTFEDLGAIIATWFSDPRFLDASGHPVPLCLRRGRGSLAHLIRISGAKVEPRVAIELLRQSPSVGFSSEGNLLALKRVFVLPKLEVPRAAFVIERYLDTLQQNTSGRHRGTKPLLERSCHVSQVDLAKIAPILRDIEGRGTAFMDSIDGDIEGRRLRRLKRKNIGELGVLVFAWTRPMGRTSAKAKRVRATAGRGKLR